MLDVRYSHLYFYQSLNRLQRGLSAIGELLVFFSASITLTVSDNRVIAVLCCAISVHTVGKKQYSTAVGTQVTVIIRVSLSTGHNIS